MALHAVDNLSDAVEATKRFLLPFDAGRWLRLAVVTFFVGGFGVSFPGGGGGSTPPPESVDGEAPSSPGEALAAVPDDVLVIAAAVVAAVVLVGLLLGFLGAVFEFVFVESLRSERVRLRRYTGKHWRRGLRLFGFRLAVTLVGFLLVAGVGALAATTLVTGPIPTWGATDVLTLLVVLLPAAFVVFALTGLVNGFTTAFVVPVMLLEERSVLGGWRRFWPTLRGNLKQYGAYVLLALVLTIAIGLLAGVAVGIGAVVLAIPFAIVGAIVVFAAGASFTTPVLVVVAVLVVAYVLLVLTLAAFVQVPLRTFLRYYTLLILGDTNETFDVIPDARAAVRS
jgi:MFS family permease